MFTAKDFFEKLYPENIQGDIEFRSLPSKRQLFIKRADLQNLPSLNGTDNHYFAVATRDGGGTKKHIQEISALWVDIDFKTTTEQEARAIIDACNLKPSAIIASGGGLHVYFFLTELLHKTDIGRVERLLKALALALRGDKGATDASRILRIPNTLNLKYDPPPIVTVEHLTDTRYAFEEISKAFGNVVHKTKRQTKKTGTKEGQRHGQAMDNAIAWAKEGFTREEIEDKLKEWSKTCEPQHEGTELTKELPEIAQWAYEHFGTEGALRPITKIQKLINIDGPVLYRFHSDLLKGPLSLNSSDITTPSRLRARLYELTGKLINMKDGAHEKIVQRITNRTVDVILTSDESILGGIIDAIKHAMTQSKPTEDLAYAREFNGIIYNQETIYIFPAQLHYSMIAFSTSADKLSRNQLIDNLKRLHFKRTTARIKKNVTRVWTGGYTEVTRKMEEFQADN